MQHFCKDLAGLSRAFLYISLCHFKRNLKIESPLGSECRGLS